MKTWFRAAASELAMILDLEDLELVALDKAGKGKYKNIEVVNWSLEDRMKLRAVATEAWADYAKETPLAKKAYDLNIAFMKKIGLLD
jgi:hypothetical protein